MTRKQDGGSNGCITARSGFYTPLRTYLSFSSAAVANKNVYIARKHRQVSKPANRQNAIFVIFSSSSPSVRLALQLLQRWRSITHQTEGISRDWLFFYFDYSETVSAPKCFWTLYSTGSKWTPFCCCVITIMRNSYYWVMNKHNHRKPVI